MTSYITYPEANVTNMTGALSYAATSLNQATGMNVFFPMIYIGFFIGALFLSNRYGFERSLLFSLFFTVIIGVFMVIAHLLDPAWLLLAIILLGLSFALGW